MTDTKKSKHKKKAEAAPRPPEDKPEDVAKELYGFSDTSCHNCGISNDDIGGFLLQCASCKKAYYCGMACFNENLPIHMQFCRTNQLESEPRGRRESVQTAVKPLVPEPSHSKNDTKDSCKVKPKGGPSKKAVPKKAVPKKAKPVQKVFIDSSCSDSDVPTDSESSSDHRGRTSTSTTAPKSASRNVTAETVATPTESIENDMTMPSEGYTPADGVSSLPDTETDITVADSTSEGPPFGADLLETKGRMETGSTLNGILPVSDPPTCLADHTSQSKRDEGLVFDSVDILNPDVSVIEPSSHVDDFTTNRPVTEAVVHETPMTPSHDEDTRRRRGGGLVQSDRAEAVQRANSLRSRSTNETVHYEHDAEWSHHRMAAVKLNAAAAPPESGTHESRDHVHDASSEAESDEDTEQTRKRRGGGLVAHPPSVNHSSGSTTRAGSLAQPLAHDHDGGLNQCTSVDSDRVVPRSLTTERDLPEEDTEETRKRRGGGLVANHPSVDHSSDAMTRTLSLAMAHDHDGILNQCTSVNSDLAVPCSLNAEGDLSDDDIEETRKRRGGGVVAKRRSADSIKRASSLTLRTAQSEQTEGGNQSGQSDLNLSQLQAWRSAASEINKEFLDTVDSDDESEDTRRRRGGGVIDRRAVAALEVKRSSSMVLRNTTQNTAVVEWDKPEWTASQLRSTQQGEAIKSVGTISTNVSRRDAQPTWISQRKLRSTSDRELLRQESERSVQSKCVCKLEDCNEPESAAGGKRSMLRKCQSCRLNEVTTQQGEAIKSQPTWVSQRKLRSASDRDLLRQESERSLQSKCTCKPEDCNDTGSSTGGKRNMLKKCHSCRLNGEVTVLPDIVRRAQNLRKEKSASNMARIDSP